MVDTTSHLGQSSQPQEFARANFPTDVPPERESPVFPIPEYMRKPQVFQIFGHQIRIWRTEVIPLTRQDSRRVCGLLEVTPLDDSHESLGHRWSYSAHVPPCWAEHAKYLFNGNYPGEQAAVSEAEIYRLTSLEIHWTIRNLSAHRQRMDEFSLKRLEREDH